MTPTEELPDGKPCSLCGKKRLQVNDTGFPIWLCLNCDAPVAVKRNDAEGTG